MSQVYLIHFDYKYHHAGHYIGMSDHLDARLEQHRRGGPHHARLMEVIVAAGISWSCVRTWNGGRKLERHLKRKKCAPRLCPVCTSKETPCGRNTLAPWIRPSHPDPGCPQCG